MKINFVCLAMVISLSMASVIAVNETYDQKYWEYQKKIGAAGGILNTFKFESYIKPTDTVIDFGCGGGFLLSNLSCARKIGIEINEWAIEQAKKNGVVVYKDSQEIPDLTADVIISNHALEHLLNPYETLCLLYKKLKTGGKIIFVVPSEQALNKCYDYKDDDQNHHLYTWTPMTLGNLFKDAGFKVLESSALRHCWVGDYIKASQQNELKAYNELCNSYALKTDNYQVRIVAMK